MWRVSEIRERHLKSDEDIKSKRRRRNLNEQFGTMSQTHFQVKEEEVKHLIGEVNEQRGISEKER